ncbi:hypothetical protein PUNSTDRAFT_134315 [Punctularia strigosozonata HHB-11173 SS5]|uniref:uncharacterized protein n=1 Tax=Punctularia strigosozonata (strain HHB-11173) TaxID=741275 RepID=UPI0004417F93|nr:uncharacterized protein PUNSTDRAFT_134315 [Punctularia strigosozonata HHB-11173 SS5]EIN09151.1 hypothetical protein PUNSTDRAFT_134315 [Punctularia strigosozonata HHB-11173 SS5]
MSYRQRRWAEYISRFDHSITYVKGKYNLVADTLSRYYKYDRPGETHPDYWYVNMDVHFDPAGDEAVESRDLKAEMLASAGSSEFEMTPPDDVPTVGTSAAQGLISPQMFSQYAEYLAAVKQNYGMDSLFSKVIAAPKEHPQFELREGTVYTCHGSIIADHCLLSPTVLRRLLRSSPLIFPRPSDGSPVDFLYL